MGDVAFELGISLGEVSKVRAGLAGVPDLDDAFTWSVRCDNAGEVTVHALHLGRVRRIARARWSDGQLVDRSGVTVEFPNEHQWQMLGTAVAQAKGEVFRGLEAGTFAPRDPVAAPVDASRGRRRIGTILVASCVVVGVVGVALLFVMRSSSAEQSDVAAPSPAPQRAPQPPPPPLSALVATAPSLGDAVALARPAMGDGVHDDGARLLARYASTKLVWTEVANGDETSVPLVLKDSERERGKQLCVTGTISDIERSDLDGRPVYVGALRTAEGDDVRFIAGGSTGLLVKRSTGTLCGVATGKHGKAAVIVGLFDLPENRTPAVER